MTEQSKAPETPDMNLPGKEISTAGVAVGQIAERIRARLDGTTIELHGKPYTVEFIEGSDPEVDGKIQEFYDFMAEPGNIDHDELADPGTFKNALVRGDIALSHIANKRFDLLTAKTQPYFFINIRDPESGKIVSAMSGAMILDRQNGVSDDGIDATFMLSYVATAHDARGKGLPQTIANQAIEYFRQKNVRVTGMLTEAVDTFEKSANKISQCSRLYVRKESGDGEAVMQQIEYLMPSQEYSLDGEPLQGTTSSSNLMMSFAGKDPTEGIPGREVKAKLTAMWDWVYRRDTAYYERKYAAEGQEPDRGRIQAAVATNNAYIDKLLAAMFAQFGDDETVFPVTAKERELSLHPFTKVPLEQINSMKPCTLEVLQPEDLDEVVRMTSAVFPQDGDHPKRCFAASLNPTDEASQSYLKEINVDSLQYWVAKTPDGKILGISGLYTTPEDAADAAWVGWYCVHPDARGLGIGSKLLDRVEAGASGAGKKALRLYTSDREEMTRANRQYEKRGYREIHREPSKTPGMNMIIRQKDLGTPQGGTEAPPLDVEKVIFL